MLLSEAEARKKWCPLARQITSLDSTDAAGKKMPIFLASANRWEENRGALCFGSGCMAWRKMAQPPDTVVHQDCVTPWEQRGYRKGEKAEKPKESRDIDAIFYKMLAPEETRGYCGAFGQPEEIRT